MSQICMGYDLTTNQLKGVADGVFKILYWDDLYGDRDRSPYEPYTVEECQEAARHRLADIHSHVKRGYGELEWFADFFYTNADFDRVTELCNEMLKLNWKWG